MKRLLSITLAFGLSLLLVSCVDEVPTTALDETGSTGGEGEMTAVAEVPSSPHSVLRSGAVGRIAGSAAKGPGNGDGFTSPLFGLATAPNGDILVADAGAGISTRSGRLEVPLEGVTDMSPIGRSAMWALKGLTGDPGEDTGQGLYRTSRGQKRLVADLYDFEENQNPDGADIIDSNPFDVQSLGGDAALVADAGANALLRIERQGQIEVVAVFPDELVPTANIKGLLECPAGPPGICNLPDEFTAQPVPTSIAVGPNGYYYVGELKGFPAPTDESNVWKIAPEASGIQCPASPKCEKAFDGGFTSIIDLAFDESGILHVTELDENSWFGLELSPANPAGGTINACELSSGTCTEKATGIPTVTAITFGKNGSLWATRSALIPGSAEVVENP